MVARLKTESRADRPSKKLIPPLQFGDRLTRSEFHRRYRAMPNLKKAELIEGVVFMPSPVSYQNHGEPHALIMGCLFNYCAATPTLSFADNVTVILDSENEVQPDALMRKTVGASYVNDEGYLEGAPELIVEIAASTASYDTHDKFRVYRRAQVQEYIIWRVLDGEIDWYYLDDGEYKLLEVDEESVIKSKVFPGFRLAINALLNNDLTSVLETVQHGIKSEEHQEFVTQQTGLSP